MNITLIIQRRKQENFSRISKSFCLGKTFPKDIPSHLARGLRGSDSTETIGKKSIRVFGAAQPVSQTKVMAQVLQEELEKGINPEETLIVLPDENLLLPVLHSVSGYVEKLNVTMGFPIGATPVFNLVEILIELQINRKGPDFNHRPVLALLGHPYLIAEDAGAANVKRKEILHRNWVYIPMGYLASETHLHRLIFRPLKGVFCHTCVPSLRPSEISVQLPILIKSIFFIL